MEKENYVKEIKSKCNPSAICKEQAREMELQELENVNGGSNSDYQVKVEWGEMDFKYTPSSQWNENEFKDEDKSITIENKSTDGVIVGFTYE